ncbi:SMC family ATPase [Bacteroides sp. 51]|uniref:SMC family ATPase n=1 Tax=Bacteroides sp. 51 TaxID=2302938 RepID=UPI0013D1C267|nr:SMC family ATPase [Bacteroides sp. 51]NDV80853.1 SMC family ATPase [Bacteroides sp. 51]
MWNLTEIYAQNICSFKELHYKIRNGVTTLIFGDNHDNESQRSNGSGKSALIETIAIGITGSPLRKIKNEEIINDSSDECFIELTFRNESTRSGLLIGRKIFRKGASEVTCFMIDPDGKNTEKILSGVDAYNRFILETLGITRSELYNNFVLSKYKYQDFLSCSDKEKKEIINRFSNGILVDQAIVNILKDKMPIQELLQKRQLELAGYDGRIEMLKEQLEKEEENKLERAQTKEEKIAGIHNLIAEKRATLRSRNDDLSRISDELAQITDADKQLQDLENGEHTLEQYLAGVKVLIPTISNTPLTDWQQVITIKQEKISQAEMELKKWDEFFRIAEEKVTATTQSYQALSESYKRFLSTNMQDENNCQNELSCLETDFQAVNTEIEQVKQVRRMLCGAIDTLKNKLAGTLSCPSCGFEFITSDIRFDVEKGKAEIKEKEKEYALLSTDIGSLSVRAEDIEESQMLLKEKQRKLAIQKNEWKDKLLSAERDVKEIDHELDMARGTQRRIIERLNQLQTDIDNVARQIFDEAFGMVDDAYKANERKKRNAEDEIKMLEGSIATLEDTLRELDRESGSDTLLALGKSLKEYQDKATDVLQKKMLIEDELRTLEIQESRFVEFRTYLANTKIEALSKITNEFLEEIGSDIRIRFSGYTYLKSGKVREKISVSLVRSGIDSGSFGKFSAGEAARVNLATILAMQKLINANCDDDKGLNLLVLDEILEAVDEDGLANMFEALNSLSLTALVVSHGNIAESYPHKIKIIKENGESYIEV